jgi:hypothetical protein
MSAQSATVIFRVEPELKKAFEEIAKEQSHTTSILLRKFMNHYVTKYRQERTETTIGSIKTKAPVSTTSAPPKTQQKPKKGQKLNRMPPRKNAK